jgi:putative MATE family efflux protein
MVKDMTNGSPSKHILGFAVPMLFGMLFQQFYNLVDTIIVGKTLGVEALAGVGATGSINFMIIGFCMGVCNGFVIPVAQCFGAKKPADLRKYVFNGYICSIVFAIVLTLASVIFCRRILIIMNTPADIIDHAYNYIVVIFIGIPTVFLYNMVSGVIRSLGDSKTPVVFLVLSSIINVVLDFFLILVCKMGVAGAGWATVTSQLISGLTCLIYMYKKYDILKGDKSERVLDRRFITNLCMNGVPMGLQYSITAIGSTILQAAVNTLGSTYVAAMTAGSKMFNFTCCPFDALGSTMATYAGQNAGAGKTDRIRQGVRSATFIGSIYSVLACIVLTLFGGVIPLLFVDASETVVIHQAHQFLTFNSLFYIPLTIVNVWRFTIQGMGYSLLAILAGVCEMIARALVGFALVPIFGYIIICFASPLAWLMADAFLIPAFYYCLRNLLKAQEMLE